MRPGFDVVVPVHDGAGVLGETLRRLAAFCGPDERILLVDDASGDPRAVAILAKAAADPRFTVHRRAVNGGFVAAANAGLALATRDVVLLNADAWVTAGWLERLHECRASSPAIGCACPLSNQATLLTIAEAGAAGLAPDAVAAAVARASAREHVRLPTAHGFCMLMTREAIDRVGVLDEAFGRGYGEENDWSMRAIRAGFGIACADGAYVHHVGEASFGRSARTDRLRRRNAALLSARWPGYRAGVSGWLRENPLRETIERATREIRREAGMPGRRLLLVAWKFGHPGGIEEHMRQALPALAKVFDTTVLCLDRLRGAWADAVERRDASGARIVQLGAEGLAVTRAISGVPAGISDARAERFLRAMLAAGGYDLVHFHSLAGWNSLALPAIAREAGCRTVFTVHDFHLLCPEGNLVDPSDRPCGKARATASDEECLACLAPRDRAAPGSPPLARLLLEREVAANRAVEALDRFIAPSRFAAERLARAWPELASRTTVIPHGVEAGRLPPPPRSSELRVAFLGRFSRRKGAAVVLEAAARLKDEMIDFAVFGPVEPGIAAPAGTRIRFHGPYRREDLPVLVRDADLVLVPSVVEESFGLVFSEALALGIPVVASPVGALAERLVDGENGFAFPAGDAEALATLLRRLCRAMHRVEEVRARLRHAAVTPVAESAAMTLEAYEQALAGAVPAPRWIAAVPGAPATDMAAWLRLDAGPAAGPWIRAKAMPPLLSMRVVVRVAAGSRPLLERTLASIGDFAPVTVLGEGERPGPVAEETVLALEAGDEVDASVLAGATRWLREHPACELVAFDEARITRSGERYGVLRRAGVNRGALECGAELGRVLARTRALDPGGDLPFDGAALALAWHARKGREAVAHRAELLAHRVDVPARPREAADAEPRPVPAFAVVIRVEERRPPIASAWQFWRNPAGGPAPVAVLLEAEAPHATLLAGALAGGSASIDLAGASGAKARLDRVLSSLAEDFALVQSDRVAWVDAEAPRALLRAASAPGVAIATALLASDGERVIHAGYTLGAGGAGLFGNVLEGWNASEPPPAPFDTPVFDVAAASRLALAVRRSAWREGQPEGECNLEFALVEQGLALTQDGGRVVVCTEARAVLLPPAGIPVDTPTTPAMRTDFLRRWSPRIANDPFHSPRLSLDPPWREESRFAKWRGDPQLAPRVVVLPPVSDSPEASRVRESLSSLAAAGRAAVMVPEDASRPVTIAQVVRLVPRVVVMQEPFDEARLATWQDVAGLGFARRVLLADPRSGDWKALAALKRAASLATRVVVADESLGRALHGSCPDIRVLPGFAPDPRAWTQAILD